MPCCFGCISFVRVRFPAVFTYLCILEVVSPQWTDLILTAHIPHCKTNILVFYRLDVETFRKIGKRALKIGMQQQIGGCRKLKLLSNDIKRKRATKTIKLLQIRLLRIYVYPNKYCKTFALNGLSNVEGTHASFNERIGWFRIFLVIFRKFSDKILFCSRRKLFKTRTIWNRELSDNRKAEFRNHVSICLLDVE